MGHFSFVDKCSILSHCHAHSIATITAMHSLSHDLSSATTAYDTNSTVLSPRCSRFKATMQTSTPNSTSWPRVDFRSVESLATSAFSQGNHGKVTCPDESRRERALVVSTQLSCPLSRDSSDRSSLCVLDDTGYQSMHSSTLSSYDDVNKENEPDSMMAMKKPWKVRGPLHSYSSRTLLILGEKKVD